MTAAKRAQMGVFVSPVPTEALYEEISGALRSAQPPGDAPPPFCALHQAVL